MTLNQVPVGARARIVRMPNGQVRAQAIRLGLTEGAGIRCAERVWNGPVVICCGRQEIAIGRALAHQIEVAPAGEA